MLQPLLSHYNINVLPQLGCFGEERGKKTNQSNLKVSDALDPLQQQFESVSQSLRSLKQSAIYSAVLLS